MQEILLKFVVPFIMQLGNKHRLASLSLDRIVKKDFLNPNSSENHWKISDFFILTAITILGGIV